LGTLKQYWKKVNASLVSPFKPQAPTNLSLAELKREILSVARDNQTLAADLGRVRADSERSGSEEASKIRALEQACQRLESAGNAAGSRLTELEQRFAEIESEGTATRDRVAALQTSLDETADRLETRNNQIKFLQDSAREQLAALKTAIAETASRLETRDSRLEDLQDAAQDQIVALQTALSEISVRQNTMDGRLEHLQDSNAELVKQYENSLSHSISQLEATHEQLRALENKMELDHRLCKDMLQETQARLERHRHWALWVALATVLVVVVVTTLA
jgi:chromosome segregation ATPase